jgi:hypothetical protein
MMQQPHDAVSLANYLEKYPILKVRYPSLQKEYTFKSYDGIRMVFRTQPDNDGGSSLVVLAVNSVIMGRIEYYEDGFTRSVGPLIGHYEYTGPKPWKEPKPEYIVNQEEWDDIIYKMDLIKD